MSSPPDELAAIMDGIIAYFARLGVQIEHMHNTLASVQQVRSALTDLLAALDRTDPPRGQP